jgi:hypothetical protein
MEQKLSSRTFASAERGVPATIAAARNVKSRILSSFIGLLPATAMRPVGAGLRAGPDFERAAPVRKRIIVGWFAGAETMIDAPVGALRAFL